MKILPSKPVYKVELSLKFSFLMMVELHFKSFIS